MTMAARPIRIAIGCSVCKSKLQNSGYCPICDEWDVCALCEFDAQDASPLCEDHTNAELFKQIDKEKHNAKPKCD